MQVHAIRFLFCPVLAVLLLAGCDGTGEFDLPLGPDSHNDADSSIKLEGGAVVNVDQIVNIWQAPATPISGPPPLTDPGPGSAPILVSPGSLTNTVGDVINRQLTVSPGAALSGSNCPRDLSILDSGLITGTISSSSALDPQPFNCSITARQNGQATTIAFAWTILPAAEA